MVGKGRENLPKNLQIYLIKKKLSKMGIDPDLVDLEALVDGSLKFKENWRRIQEIVKGGVEDKFKRLKKEDELIIHQAQQVEEMRSEKARQVDEAIAGTIPWGRKITIVGLQGSGKTYLAQNYFLKNMKQHLVIDPNNEYEGFNRYIPKYADDYEKLIQELKLAVKRLIKPNVRWIEKEKNRKKVKKPLHLVVFDEADLYMPSKKNLPAPVRYLYVECRHMQLDLIAITRRLTDLNAYPVEVSDYLILFKQTGYNDLKRLREIAGKEAEKLMKEKVDYSKHNFIFLDRDRVPKLINSMNELKEVLPYP
jgi:hypothetical protein